MFTHKEEIRSQKRVGIILLTNPNPNPGARNNSLQIQYELQQYIKSQNDYTQIISEDSDIYEIDVETVAAKFDVDKLIARMNDNMHIYNQDNNNLIQYDGYAIITAGEYGVNALEKFYNAKTKSVKLLKVFFSGHLIFEKLPQIVKQGYINYMILPAYIVNNLDNQTKQLFEQKTELYAHQTGVPYNLKLQDTEDAFKKCTDEGRLAFDKNRKNIILFLGGDAHNAAGVKQRFEDTQAAKIIAYFTEQAKNINAILYVNSIGRISEEIVKYCKNNITQEHCLYLEKNIQIYQALLACSYNNDDVITIVSGDQTSAVTEIHDFAKNMFIIKISSMDETRNNQANLFRENSYAQILNADNDLSAWCNIDFAANIERVEKVGYDICTHNIVTQISKINISKKCLGNLFIEDMIGEIQQKTLSKI